MSSDTGSVHASVAAGMELGLGSGMEFGLGSGMEIDLVGFGLVVA